MRRRRCVYKGNPAVDQSMMFCLYVRRDRQQNQICTMLAATTEMAFLCVSLRRYMALEQVGGQRFDGGHVDRRWNIEGSWTKTTIIIRNKALCQ